MKEIYIINGREIDLTNVSQTDKIIWLSENPGAELKKVEGAATDVNVAPLQDIYTSQDNGELVLENTSSVSQGNDIGYFNPEGKGKIPGYFNENTSDKVQEGINASLGKNNIKDLLPRNDQSGFNDINVQLAVDNNFITKAIAAVEVPLQNAIMEAFK